MRRLDFGVNVYQHNSLIVSDVRIFQNPTFISLIIKNKFLRDRPATAIWVYSLLRAMALACPS